MVKIEVITVGILDRTCTRHLKKEFFVKLSAEIQAFLAGLKIVTDRRIAKKNGMIIVIAGNLVFINVIPSKAVIEIDCGNEPIAIELRKMIEAHIIMMAPTIAKQVQSFYGANPIVLTRQSTLG